MFNSTVLDLVILLSFTYFIGGILISALNEALLGFFARKDQLKKAIATLFFSDDWKNFVENHFNVSPHIESLMREKGKYPAYIPDKNFVQAILENVDKAALETGTIKSVVDTNGKAILPDEMIKVLDNILSQVKNLPGWEKEFEGKLEIFYNNAMDRVGGWYKRKVRRFLLILGFLLAVLLNLDTIKIINDSLSNKKALSSRADKIVSDLNKFSQNDSVVVIKDDSGHVVLTQWSRLDTTFSGDTSKNKLQKTFKQMQVKLEEDAGTGYGYSSVDAGIKEWFGNGEGSGRNRFGRFLAKLLGVLLTAFALQMGSNYWFDILNKAANLRAVGKKPEEKKT